MNRTFSLRYIFCVSGFAPRIALSAEADSARFMVSIPWYHTQITYVVSGFLILAAIFLGVRWYSTRLLRKKNASFDAANTAKSLAAAPAAIEITKNTAPLRALIVEDIDYNAAAMQAMLRKLGIESDVARDGPTALKRLQNSFYDLAFMDWNLPGLTGTEVVTRFRATEAPGRRTMIIATTAYSTAANREACVEAGMDAFIARPFAPEKISAVLHQLRGSLRPAASTKRLEPVKEQAPPIAGIDLRVLKFLAQESAEGLGKQIDRYLGFFESDRSVARKVIAGGNVREIHRIAHRLAGHASMVNFQPLVSLASELQTHATGGNPAKLRELLAEFDREFASFRSKLESFRASMGLA